MAVPIKKKALPHGADVARDEYSNGEMNQYFMKSSQLYKRILKD